MIFKVFHQKNKILDVLDVREEIIINLYVDISLIDVEYV